MTSRDATPEELRSGLLALDSERRRSDGAPITGARCVVPECAHTVTGKNLGVFDATKVYFCVACGDEALILRMDVQE